MSVLATVGISPHERLAKLKRRSRSSPASLTQFSAKTAAAESDTSTSPPPAQVETFSPPQLQHSTAPSPGTSPLHKENHPPTSAPSFDSTMPPPVPWLRAPSHGAPSNGAPSNDPGNARKDSADLDKLLKDIMGEDQASAPSEKQQLEDKMLSALSTVLHSMSEVKVKMQAYSNYFETQQETDHALYEWPAYDKHQELKAAIQTLENANNDLNSVHREPTDVLVRSNAVLLFKRVTKTSIVISNAAASAFAVMRAKVDTCFEEVDDSDLDEGDKEPARGHINGIVERLLQHTTACSQATHKTQSLLLDILYGDRKGPDSSMDLDVGVPQTQTVERMVQSMQKAHTLATSRDRFWKRVTMLLLASMACFVGLVIIAVISIRADHSYDLQPLAFHNGTAAASFNTTSLVDWDASMREIMTMHTQQVDLAKDVHRVGQVLESFGFRMDHLWETLGPPNEQGTYFSMSKPKDDNDRFERQITEMAQAVKEQQRQAVKEIVELRRHIHRVDLRLTKRLDYLRK